MTEWCLAPAHNVAHWGRGGVRVKKIQNTEELILKVSKKLFSATYCVADVSKRIQMIGRCSVEASPRTSIHV